MPSILSYPAPTVAYKLSFDVLYEVQTNVSATSLHGRDLEGLVGVATGLLASRDISRCRREEQAGPRPADLLLLVISSLQVSIPAIGFPATYAA